MKAMKAGKASHLAWEIKEKAREKAEKEAGDLWLVKAYTKDELEAIKTKAKAHEKAMKASRVQHIAMRHESSASSHE